MSDDNRDIATLYGDAYATTVPRVLGGQHRVLLDSLEASLASKTSPLLLVLGPGGYVLPYSCKYTEDGKLGTTNRDRIKKIIGDGRIVLLDYVVDYDQSGLVKELDVLTKMGFFEPKYFRVGCFIHEGSICPTHTPPGTISFIKNDLRDQLRVASNSVDAVDANLAIHHASVTRAELARVYKEIYRVLKPGGMLHLGEGNVSMNHTEDKLVRIGQDVAELNKRQICLSDCREIDSGYKLRAVFEPGKKYDCLPVVRETPNHGITMVVSRDGDVIAQTMDDAETAAKQMKEKGYCTVAPCGRTSIKMPLIDPLMQGDVERHIAPVNRFYDAINDSIVKGYAKVAKDLVEKITEGVEDERANAKKGVVEYYMGEQQILAALNDAGFVGVKVMHHETEPFYNITAMKL
jgi:SAM-dependent methyltransferase